MSEQVNTIRTVGHGTLAADAFAELLRGAGVDLLVDIRRYPGSRHNPQFRSEDMAQWLPEHGVAYELMLSLGGRRKPSADSPNTGLRNEQFRAYADYMATDEFGDAVAELLTRAATQHVAVMCSEAVWWRCHRRLLSDYLVLVKGVSVEHLFHDGRLTPHPVTPEATLVGKVVAYQGAPA